MAEQPRGPMPPSPPATPKPTPPQEGQAVLDPSGRRLMDPDGRFFIHSALGDPCCPEPLEPCEYCESGTTPERVRVTFSGIEACTECHYNLSFELLGSPNFTTILYPWSECHWHGYGPCAIHWTRWYPLDPEDPGCSGPSDDGYLSLNWVHLHRFTGGWSVHSALSQAGQDYPIWNVTVFQAYSYVADCTSRWVEQITSGHCDNPNAAFILGRAVVRPL